MGRLTTGVSGFAADGRGAIFGRRLAADNARNEESKQRWSHHAAPLAPVDPLATVNRLTWHRAHPARAVTASRWRFARKARQGCCPVDFGGSRQDRHNHRLDGPLKIALAIATRRVEVGKLGRCPRGKSQDDEKSEGRRSHQKDLRSGLSRESIPTLSRAGEASSINCGSDPY